MKRSGYLQQRDVRTQVLLDVMQRTMKQYNAGHAVDHDARGLWLGL